MIEDDKQPFPWISFTRKAVQLISFFVINFVVIELIFNIKLEAFRDTFQIYPFLQTPRDSWSTGAGLLEYILYAIGKGEVPFLLIGFQFLIILFTARFFCGWVCPIGFIQDLLSSLPKANKTMKIKTDASLKKIKFYIILIMLALLIFLGIIHNTDIIRWSLFKESLGNFTVRPLGGFSMSEFLFYTLPEAVITFWESFSLAEFFDNGWQIFGFIFYFIVLGISVYYPRFYCRTLCPYGAVSAYISEYSFLKLSRNPVKCTGRKECGICEKVCPIQIRILDEPFGEFTGKGECNLCMRCKEACPHNAINLKFG